MKKATALLLIICLTALFCAPAFSLTLDDYEPYSKDEFPKWSLDLRRAECIFFGGIPIAFPLTALTLNVVNTDVTFVKTLGIACAVSAAIALIDYIIGVFNAD